MWTLWVLKQVLATPDSEELVLKHMSLSPPQCRAQHQLWSGCCDTLEMKLQWWHKVSPMVNRINGFHHQVHASGWNIVFLHKAHVLTVWHQEYQIVGPTCCGCGLHEKQTMLASFKRFDFISKQRKADIWLLRPSLGVLSTMLCKEYVIYRNHIPSFPINHQ